MSSKSTTHRSRVVIVNLTSGIRTKRSLISIPKIKNLWESANWKLKDLEVCSVLVVSLVFAQIRRFSSIVFAIASILLNCFDFADYLML